MTDVLDLPNIPDSVRDRIQNLRDVAGDRRVALLKVSDDRSAAWTAKAHAEDQLAAARRAGFFDEAAAPGPQLLDQIRRQTATLQHCDARTAEMQPGWEQAARLLASLEAYVGAHAARIVPHEGVSAQLLKGEAVLDGLARAARRTRTLRADRDEILAAPFPTSVAKKIAREQMAARVEAAKPDVAGLVDSLEAIKFPMNRASIEQHGGPPTDPIAVTACDPIGLLAWIFPKEFQAAVDREIDASGDDAIALTIEQRKAKLAQIDGDILASEREEAEFATLAGRLPREDCDPRAALGLADTTPAPERD